MSGKGVESRVEVARRTQDAQEQASLLHESLSLVRRTLAKNPALVEHVQEVLSQDDDRDVVEVLAFNPNLVARLQEALSEHPDHNVRASLASNTALAATLQARLAKDTEAAVRLELADNPALVPEVQEMLWADPAAYIQATMAQNPALTEALQRRLVSEGTSFLRRRLSSNRAVTTAVQELLLSDKETWEGLADNPSLVLSPSLPVAVLGLSGRGRTYLERELAGLDVAACKVLVNSWEGTVAELVVTVASFSGD